MAGGITSQLALIGTAANILVLVLTLFIVFCTLMPFIKTGRWFVRACDFPRLQLLMVCGVALIAVLIAARSAGWDMTLTVYTVLILLSAGWQAFHIARYTGLWTETVPNSDHSDLRLLISNLDYENNRSRDVIDTICEIDPQVLLLIEIDERWNSLLAEIKKAYPHRVESIRQKGLGIALWSRIPIVDSQIEFLISENRPSVWATLKHQDTDIRFVGVHPTPPGLSKREHSGRHDSRIRDAELVMIAKRIEEDSDAAWVVAGDFNDVAWSHTTRLFQRLSGLKDPRIGRGMFSTYHAQRPLLRYPLDHIFVSPGFKVSHLGRVNVPGSDHFGIFAELDVPDAAKCVEPKPDQEDRREAEDLIAQGHEDAEAIGHA